MKRKHLIFLGAVAVIVVGYVLAILPNIRHRAEWKQAIATLQGLPRERISAAAHGFARDRKVAGSTVPLQSLLSAGYLQSEDVRGLEGKDVAISVTANEATPSQALIHVRASDGSDIVLLADGSIQKMVRR